MEFKINEVAITSGRTADNAAESQPQIYQSIWSQLWKHLENSNKYISSVMEASRNTFTPYFSMKVCQT